MAPKMEKQAIHEFAAELSRATGAAVDPRYSEHHWAFALILEPGIRLFAKIESGKAVYSLMAFASDGRATSIPVECGVTVNRGAEIAAQQIRSRLLPDAMPLARAALDRFKDEDSALDRVARKAAALAKRYNGNLRIQVSPHDRNRITVQTKYGAGFHLDCYAYEDSRSGEWRLTSERGTAFWVDNIDTRAGRAFLKLCNEN